MLSQRETARPSALRIAVLFPELLGTYADRGNVTVLVRRAEWRGFPVEVVEVPLGRQVPRSADLYVLGGGEDAAQGEAADALTHSHGLSNAAVSGAVVFGVCAGLQLLGETFLGPDGTTRHGAGLLTVSSERLPRRAVGEVVTDTQQLGLGLLTGFENHAGETTVSAPARPLGAVVRGVGNGDGTEGAVQGNVVGTYLHGPVLARNPALADHLLQLALGQELAPLSVPEVQTLRDQRLAQVRPYWPWLRRQLPHKVRAR
jgi:CobQ-like glutamine amidotransferase family enzyme